MCHVTKLFWPDYFLRLILNTNFTLFLVLFNCICFQFLLCSNKLTNHERFFLSILWYRFRITQVSQDLQTSSSINILAPINLESMINSEETVKQSQHQLPAQKGFNTIGNMIVEVPCLLERYLRCKTWTSTRSNHGCSWKISTTFSG